MRWFRRRRAPKHAEADSPTHRRALREVRSGVKLGAEGRLPEALVHLERAVELAPTMLDARLNLGSVYYQLAVSPRHDDRLGDSVAGALSGDRADPRQGWLDAAAGHFRYVLGLDPNHIAANLNLAATLNALGQQAEALRLLEELARRRPDHRDVHYNLAVAYLQAGRRADAEASLAQELDHHPDHQLALALRQRLG